MLDDKLDSDMKKIVLIVIYSKILMNLNLLKQMKNVNIQLNIVLQKNVI